MAVQNIECQIAQGQITRYLAGDSFSPDMAVELRSHIAECLDCAAVLESKRAILMGMLQGQTVHAAVQIPDREPDLRPDEAEDEPQAPRNPLTQKLIGLLGGPKVRQVPVAAQKLESGLTTIGYWRPLLYSGALGLVLFLMSFVLRDPTRFFGERAIESGETTVAAGSTGEESANKQPTVSAPAVGTGSGAVTQPAGEQAKPGESDGQPANPSASSEAAPGGAQAQPNSSADAPSEATTTPRYNANPAVKRPSDTTTRRSSGSRRPAAPPAKPQGIKVYDAQGNPIS